MKNASLTDAVKEITAALALLKEESKKPQKAAPAKAPVKASAPVSAAGPIPNLRKLQRVLSRVQFSKEELVLAFMEAFRMKHLPTPLIEKLAQAFVEALNTADKSDETVIDVSSLKPGRTPPKPASAGAPSGAPAGVSSSVAKTSGSMQEGLDAIIARREARRKRLAAQSKAK